MAKSGSTAWTTAICALIAPAVVAAQSFRLLTSEDTGHYDVNVTVASVTSVIAVRIANDDPVAVNCRVSFDTGPDTIVRRVRVDSSAVRTVSYGLRRTTTQKVQVTTVCRGVADDTDDPDGRSSAD